MTSETEYVIRTLVCVLYGEAHFTRIVQLLVGNCASGWLECVLFICSVCARVCAYAMAIANILDRCTGTEVLEN